MNRGKSHAFSSGFHSDAEGLHARCLGELLVCLFVLSCFDLFIIFFLARGDCDVCGRALQNAFFSLGLDPFQYNTVCTTQTMLKHARNLFLSKKKNANKDQSLAISQYTTLSRI